MSKVKKVDLKPVDTWYGKRWAVVDEEGFSMVVENRLAQFPYNKEGLAEAREAYKVVKNLG